jgi:hypothetical protein
MTGPVHAVPARSSNPAIRQTQRRHGFPVPGVIGKGGGKPLDVDIRTMMESRFSTDFSAVRIHDDDRAAATASAVHAQAYAVADEIVFSRGTYAPRTIPGMRLLAHELAHVVQQRPSRVAGATADQIAISDPMDRAEREAEAIATSLTGRSSLSSSEERFARRESLSLPTPVERTPVGLLQRQAAPSLPATTPVPTAAPAPTTTPAPTATPAPPKGKRTGRPITDLEKEFRDMIRSAREKGYNVAADNLEHFLNGHGATRSVPLAWLRGFSVVTNAEKTNQGRFEDQLKKAAKKLAPGASTIFSDHWDKAFTAGLTEELYYASGTSELSSAGTFTLTRMGNTVTITGVVNQRWHDPYDWNPGAGAWIPGYGFVSDSVGLDLKDAGVGHDYLLENLYRQSVTGTYTIQAAYRPDTSSFTWTGP